MKMNTVRPKDKIDARLLKIKLDEEGA